MKKLINIIVVLIFFILLFTARAYWDSYRFYKKGMGEIKGNPVASIRYFGSSKRAVPIFTKYSAESTRMLKSMASSVEDPVMKRMIDDELL